MSGFKISKSKHSIMLFIQADRENPTNIVAEFKVNCFTDLSIQIVALL